MDLEKLFYGFAGMIAIAILHHKDWLGGLGQYVDKKATELSELNRPVSAV